MSIIITLSGLDGVGKTTQCKKIKSYFEEKYLLSAVNTEEFCNNYYEDDKDFGVIFDKVKNYDVILTRLFLSSFKTNEIKKKLFYEASFDNNPIINDMIMNVVENSRKYYDKVIEPLIKMENKIIIFDRFLYDEIAYRSLYGIDKQQIQQNFNYYPKADLRFYLKASLDIIRSRNDRREDSKTNLFKNVEKLNELVNNFEYTCKTFNMIEINAEQDDISKDIINKVENVCGQFLKNNLGEKYDKRN